jgi:hypothetical protein
MTFGRAALAATALAVVLACSTAPREAPRWKVRLLDSPAASDSGELNLAAAPGGRVFLTWLEPRDESSRRLRLAARRRGEAWSEPRTIAQGTDFFVNWADVPSLVALDDGTLLAHWLAKNGGGAYGYDVRVSVSRDRGASWTPYVVPHSDRTRTEHGFVSMIPWPGGGAGLFWLDGRQTAQGDAGAGSMALAHATIDSEGKPGADRLLDDRVCDCCQTAAAATGRGAVVVYRDRTDDEVRDVSVVRFEAGEWTEAALIHDDGWVMNGCPVNGPALAAAGLRVVVAWFTAPDERAQVRIAFSTDGGSSFSKALAIDGGRPLGRVDTVLLPEGDALVSWLEQGPKGAELSVRQVGVDGPRGPAFRVAELSSARASGFPRLELAGGEPVLAWRDAQEPARVQTAVLERDLR